MNINFSLTVIYTLINSQFYKSWLLYFTIFIVIVYFLPKKLNKTVKSTPSKHYFDKYDKEMIKIINKVYHLDFTLLATQGVL